MINTPTWKSLATIIHVANAVFYHAKRLDKMGLDVRKPVFGRLRTTHPRSLISAFVFRFLESITSKLVTYEISTF